jgi:chromosome partitioning protein
MNAEARGEVPKAQRVPRGSTQVRVWDAAQLPEIGARFGFLQPPLQHEVICVYTAKGGVLKTTFSYCFARLLALHGIKTLIVGLDIQRSITDIALPPKSVETLSDAGSQRLRGLYHMLYEDALPSEIIKTTDLPTLHVVPETPELSLLEKRLHLETLREFVFRDRLLPLIHEYQVVIFDNGPNWMQLTQNSLAASTTLISPLGCDLGTYQALEVNLGTISEFQKTLGLTWRNVIVIPTLLENTKLSQQIHGAYLSQCQEESVATPIRRAVKGQECLVFRQTPIEYDPKSPLAHEYAEVVREVWERIVGAQRTTTKVA